MNTQIEFILYSLLIITSLISLYVKDLLAAVVIASAYSFSMALLFVSMGAVDVGFTEAVVGAGVLGVFFVTALFATTRKTKD